MCISKKKFILKIVQETALVEDCERGCRFFEYAETADLVDFNETAFHLLCVSSKNLFLFFHWNKFFSSFRCLQIVMKLMLLKKTVMFVFLDATLQKKK